MSFQKSCIRQAACVCFWFSCRFFFLLPSATPLIPSYNADLTDINNVQPDALQSELEFSLTLAILDMIYRIIVQNIWEVQGNQGSPTIKWVFVIFFWPHTTDKTTIVFNVHVCWGLKCQMLSKTAFGMAIRHALHKETAQLEKNLKKKNYYGTS